MRFLLSALILASAAAMAGPAEDLTGLEQQLTDALFRSDADAVGALWSDDLVWIGLNGKPSSKAVQVEGMKKAAGTGSSGVLSVRNKDVKVILHDGWAVVTVASTWTTRTPSGERETDFVATHAWSRETGRWQLVAAHISRVGQP